MQLVIHVTDPAPVPTRTTVLSPEHTGDTIMKSTELLLLYSHWNHYQGESSLGHSVFPFNISTQFSSLGCHLPCQL